MRESTAEQSDCDDISQVVTSLRDKSDHDRDSRRDALDPSRPAVCRDLFGRHGEVDNRPDWCETELAKLSRGFAARWDLELEPESNNIIITDAWEVCHDVPEVYLRMLEHPKTENNCVRTTNRRTAFTQRRIS
ncbi:unnamed protein product, partial [Ixodes persulcatus]